MSIMMQGLKLSNREFFEEVRTVQQWFERSGTTYVIEILYFSSYFATSSALVPLSPSVSE